MQKREKAVEKFLQDRKCRDDVQWALLCGSYAVGNQTKYSDIDIHIVLTGDIQRRERWNQVIDGFLIEYFANPPKQLEAYRKNDIKNFRKVDATVFVTWKILFDKTWVLNDIQKQCKEHLEIPFDTLKGDALAYQKYHLWDDLENLKDVYEQGSPAYTYVAMLLIDLVLETYRKYLWVAISSRSKLYRHLTDDSFRANYGLGEFPDKVFVEHFLSVLEDPTFEVIENLVDYVLEEMWWFEIDGWKLRSPVSYI